MPSHFDRFRLLNDTPNRIRNESDVPIYVRAYEDHEPLVVEPGVAMPLPESENGETIIDVPREDP